MIVVDASAVLELLLRTPGAAFVEARFADGSRLHAPHLLDLEVAQVLRRYERSGTLSSRRALEALEDLRALPVERYPHHLFLSRIWEFRSNLTAYDACYVVLAETLDALLLTADRRLAAALGNRIRVEIVPAGG